jgi:hypothetical protein
LTARIDVASSSSQRATGTPAWTVAIAVATAACVVGNEQTAAEIASGIGRSRNVSSVMIPSVPSEPTNRCVRS